MGTPTQGTGTTTNWSDDGSGYDPGPYALPNDGSQWSFATVMVLFARLINSVGAVHTALTDTGVTLASYTGASFTIAAGSLSTFLHLLADKAAKLDATAQTFTGTMSIGGNCIVSGNAQCASLSNVQTNCVDLRVGSGSPSSGGGVGVVGINDAGTPPAGTPSGGGVLYSQGGALKWKGSSGTVTTIAPA